eukprot:3420597-Amphidinium_carterae.1
MHVVSAPTTKAVGQPLSLGFSEGCAATSRSNPNSPLLTPRSARQRAQACPRTEMDVVMYRDVGDGGVRQGRAHSEVPVQMRCRSVSALGSFEVSCQL